MSELGLEGSTGAASQDRAVNQSVRDVKERALTVTGRCRVGRRCVLKRGMSGHIFLGARDALHLSGLSVSRWRWW